MKTVDLHWMAGLLEGEGCFSMRGRRVKIDLGMTDLDVVVCAHGLMGGSLSSWPLPSGKTVYYARASGKRAVGWMMTLYSLMCARRQQKIRDILTRWRALPRRRRNQFDKGE